MLITDSNKEMIVIKSESGYFRVVGSWTFTGKYSDGNDSLAPTLSTCSFQGLTVQMLLISMFLLNFEMVSSFSKHLFFNKFLFGDKLEKENSIILIYPRKQALCCGLIWFPPFSYFCVFYKNVKNEAFLCSVACLSARLSWNNKI